MNGQLVQGGLVTFVTVTIANNATASSKIDLGNMRLVGILTPAALTTADITFNESYDGTNYAPLYDSTPTAQKIPGVTAGNSYRLSEAMQSVFKGVRWLQLVSSNAQGAARTLTLAVRSWT